MDYINIPVTTVSPLLNVTRLNGFIRASTTGGSRERGYYSNGIVRPNERLCIVQYTLEGCGETWVGNRRWRVPEGRAFINIINRVDTGYRYPRDEERTWRFVTFTFIDGNVRELFGELIARFGPVYDLSRSHDALTRITERIDRRQGQVYSLSESSSIYSAIQAMLLDSVTIDDTRERGIVNRIHELVEKRVRSVDSIRFGVGEAAEMLGYSREHLSRLYRDATGRTLKAYIDYVRVEYICELLETHDCAATARLVGMDSPANLTAYFKRCTGMTPSEYKASGELASWL